MSGRERQSAGCGLAVWDRARMIEDRGEGRPDGGETQREASFGSLSDRARVGGRVEYRGVLVVWSLGEAGAGAGPQRQVGQPQEGARGGILIPRLPSRGEREGK